MVRLVDEAKIERRATPRPVELRDAADGARVLAGYAVVFDSLSADLGGFREMIAPSALTKTVAETDVLAYAYHDPTQLLGRTSSGTVRLSIDDVGLAYEIDLPDTTVGRDLATLAARGDVAGSSFGFRTIRDSWAAPDDGPAIRTVEELALHHIAPTPDPAYPDTSAALRSLSVAVDLDLAVVADASSARDLGGLFRQEQDHEEADAGERRESTLPVFASFVL